LESLLDFKIDNLKVNVEIYHERWNVYFKIVGENRNYERAGRKSLQTFSTLLCGLLLPAPPYHLPAPP